ncbi:tRNA pseudouridine(38-40) synthase TruA [archaeon]|nr:tRNA pseudouridine(38-40) synthase TruA [archaeon]
MRWALKVYYDGRYFFGSQRQPDKRTAEGELLDSLGKLNIDVSDFKSSCRTDRGVSALGNVFVLSSNSRIIPSAINSTLPDDMKVLGVRKVDSSFNPRYEAHGKAYKYFLYDEGYKLSKMKKASEAFIGEHNFHNFAKLEGRNPIRSIKSIEIEKIGDFFVFTISGKSFLYQMVRRMVSAMKTVGDGLMAPAEIKKLLNPKHDNIINPLPPENLVLWEVEYPFEIGHDEYSVKRLKKDILKRQVEMKRKTLLNELLLGEI